MDNDKEHICPRRAESGRQIAGLSNVDHYRADHTCSYCGSYDPDKFMELMELGTPIGSTDKNYKVYLPTVRVHGAGKFYFQHLNVEQRKRFVLLYNNKTIQFEGGGGFYVFPFFMKPLAAIKPASDAVN